MYRHIAYDNDAPLLAAMMFSDAMPAVPVYRISSVKRGRDGTLEVRLVDRLTALDRLAGLESRGIEGLYQALNASAAALSTPEETPVENEADEDEGAAVGAQPPQDLRP